MDLAYLVRNARVEQNTFGRGGLASINMGHDADIAIALDRCGASHGNAFYQR
jgi:hypothetical protein